MFLAVLPLLNDEAETVVGDAIYALSHIASVRAAPHIIPFANHENDEVRQAVAFGLGGVDTSDARKALLELIKDRNADVRDCATFSLEELSEADSDEIRAALASALSDDDANVRYEVIIGLGYRRDRRAVRHLKLLLREDPEDFYARKATTRLLGLVDSGQITTVDLLGALQQFQQ